MSENRHHHHHHSNQSHKKMKWQNLIAVLVVLAVVIGGFAFFANYLQNRGTGSQGETTANTNETGRLRTIQFKDKTYRQKGDIRTYVLMGVDHMDQGNTMERGNKGQNDLLLAIVVNDSEETYQILQVNRDTMTDVIQTDIKGKQTGTAYQQIALAHSYGDGKELSCQNTVNTLSKMLWDQEFEGYVSIDMEAVNVAAGAVGGVPVTVEDDFSEIDPTLVQGETVTLDSSNALTFVRTRYGVADESNMNRQKRQQAFMQSFIQKASALGETQINDVYNQLQDYMLSDLPNSSVVNLMNKLKNYEELPIVTMEGTNKVNTSTNFNEFTVKSSSLQDIILKLFWNEQ
jgi:LCP family protein required for cell wall assembly